MYPHPPALDRKYEQKLKSRPDKIGYIGPQSLFDSNFIPPKFLVREKQSRLLSGVILDSLTDNYPTNLVLYGLKGTGKNLITNHFLAWLNEFPTGYEGSDRETGDSNDERPKLLQIDCAQKTIDQVIIEIIDDLSLEIHRELKLDKIFNAENVKLWNLLKILLRKIDRIVIVHLQQSENLSKDDLNRFYQLTKNSSNLRLITAMNTGMQQYLFKEYDYLDHRIQLNPYNSTELYKITRDRTTMAFSAGLQTEAVQQVVDYICDFDLMTPGACMNYLKEIYPRSEQNISINSEALRNISQYYFDGFSLDAVSIADFIMTTTLEERLFLEYVVNSFQKKNKYYVTFNEVKQAYLMTAEELGYEGNRTEFNQSFQKFTESHILRPSRVFMTESNMVQQGVHTVPHYLTIPLEEVDEILKFSFGMME